MAVPPIAFALACSGLYIYLRLVSVRILRLRKVGDRLARPTMIGLNFLWNHWRRVPVPCEMNAGSREGVRVEHNLPDKRLLMVVGVLLIASVFIAKYAI